MFALYNYLSAAFIILTLILYNIGFSPFSENLLNKSYIPSNNIKKYLTLTTILIGQLVIFTFILYILITQHKSIDVLLTNI